VCKEETLARSGDDLLHACAGARRANTVYSFIAPHLIRFPEYSILDTGSAGGVAQDAE
jgi:hypothetical protein